MDETVPSNPVEQSASPSELDLLTSTTQEAVAEIVDFMDPNEGNVGLVGRGITSIVSGALRAKDSGMTTEQILAAINDGAASPLTT
jgi:hypothetical protein